MDNVCKNIGIFLDIVGKCSYNKGIQVISCFVKILCTKFMDIDMFLYNKHLFSWLKNRVLLLNLSLSKLCILLIINLILDFHLMFLIFQYHTFALKKFQGRKWNNMISDVDNIFLDWHNEGFRANISPLSFGQIFDGK